MKTIPALIAFARDPVPGRVKTRLQAALSTVDVARLYQAFLSDAADQYEALSCPVRWYVDSPGVHSDPAFTQNVHATVHDQRGADLGERMANAFAETFAAGHQAAVVVGTDHPTLPSAFIELALQQLSRPGQFVIGPSDDGGYYLLGMSRLYPAVFEDMTYSHGDVFEQTVDRAARTGADITVLPTWYDVDTPDDLKRLAMELAGSESRAQATRLVLESLPTFRTYLNQEVSR